MSTTEKEELTVATRLWFRVTNIPIFIWSVILGVTNPFVKLYHILSGRWDGTRSKHRRLLCWLEEVSKREVRDLDAIWKDGSILCDAIHSVVAGVCDESRDHKGNPLRHAQDLATHVLHLPPSFSHSELQKELSPSMEKRFWRYLLSLRHALTLRVTRNSVEEEKDPEYLIADEYVARGMGLMTAGINQRAVFFVYCKDDSSLADIMIEIRGPNGEYGTVTSGEDSDTENSNTIPVDYRLTTDCLKVCYQPKSLGHHELYLTRYGFHIPGSPFPINVEKSIGLALERWFYNQWFAEEEEERQKKEEEKRKKMKVVSRVIDFVTEKMYLTDDGKLIKVEDDQNHSQTRRINRRARCGRSVSPRPKSKMYQPNRSKSLNNQKLIQAAECIQTQYQEEKKKSYRTVETQVSENLQLFVFQERCENIVSVCDFLLKNTSKQKSLEILTAAENILVTPSEKLKSSSLNNLINNNKFTEKPNRSDIALQTNHDFSQDEDEEEEYANENNLIENSDQTEQTKCITPEIKIIKTDSLDEVKNIVKNNQCSIANQTDNKITLGTLKDSEKINNNKYCTLGKTETELHEKLNISEDYNQIQTQSSVKSKSKEISNSNSIINIGSPNHNAQYARNSFKTEGHTKLSNSSFTTINSHTHDVENKLQTVNLATESQPEILNNEETPNRYSKEFNKHYLITKKTTLAKKGKTICKLIKQFENISDRSENYIQIKSNEIVLDKENVENNKSVINIIQNFESNKDSTEHNMDEIICRDEIKIQNEKKLIDEKIQQYECNNISNNQEIESNEPTSPSVEHISINDIKIKTEAKVTMNVEESITNNISVIKIPSIEITEPEKSSNDITISDIVETQLIEQDTMAQIDEYNPNKLSEFTDKQHTKLREDETNVLKEETEEKSKELSTDTVETFKNTNIPGKSIKSNVELVETEKVQTDILEQKFEVKQNDNLLIVTKEVDSNDKIHPQNYKENAGNVSQIVNDLSNVNEIQLLPNIDKTQDEISSEKITNENFTEIIIRSNNNEIDEQVLIPNTIKELIVDDMENKEHINDGIKIEKIYKKLTAQEERKISIDRSCDKIEELMTENAVSKVDEKELTKSNRTENFPENKILTPHLEITQERPTPSVIDTERLHVLETANEIKHETNQERKILQIMETAELIQIKQDNDSIFTAETEKEIKGKTKEESGHLCIMDTTELKQNGETVKEKEIIEKVELMLEVPQISCKATTELSHITDTTKKVKEGMKSITRIETNLEKTNETIAVEPLLIDNEETRCSVIQENKLVEEGTREFITNQIDELQTEDKQKTVTAEQIIEHLTDTLNNEEESKLLQTEEVEVICTPKQEQNTNKDTIEQESKLLQMNEINMETTDTVTSGQEQKEIIEEQFQEDVVQHVRNLPQNSTIFPEHHKSDLLSDVTGTSDISVIEKCEEITDAMVEDKQIITELLTDISTDKHEVTKEMEIVKISLTENTELEAVQENQIELISKQINNIENTITQRAKDHDNELTTVRSQYKIEPMSLPANEVELREKSNDIIKMKIQTQDEEPEFVHQGNELLLIVNKESEQKPLIEIDTSEVMDKGKTQLTIDENDILLSKEIKTELMAEGKLPVADGNEIIPTTEMKILGFLEEKPELIIPENKILPTIEVITSDILQEEIELLTQENLPKLAHDINRKEEPEKKEENMQYKLQKTEPLIFVESKETEQTEKLADTTVETMKSLEGGMIQTRDEIEILSTNKVNKIKDKMEFKAQQTQKILDYLDFEALIGPEQESKTKANKLCEDKCMGSAVCDKGDYEISSTKEKIESTIANESNNKLILNEVSVVQENKEIKADYKIKYPNETEAIETIKLNKYKKELEESKKYDSVTTAESKTGIITNEVVKKPPNKNENESSLTIIKIVEGSTTNKQENQMETESIPMELDIFGSSIMEERLNQGQLNRTDIEVMRPAKEEHLSETEQEDNKQLKNEEAFVEILPSTEGSTNEEMEEEKLDNMVRADVLNTNITKEIKTTKIHEIGKQSTLENNIEAALRDLDKAILEVETEPQNIKTVFDSQLIIASEAKVSELKIEELETTETQFEILPEIVRTESEQNQTLKTDSSKTLEIVGEQDAVVNEGQDQVSPGLCDGHEVSTAVEQMKESDKRLLPENKESTSDIAEMNALYVVQEEKITKEYKNEQAPTKTDGTLQLEVVENKTIETVANTKQELTKREGREILREAQVKYNNQEIESELLQVPMKIELENKIEINKTKETVIFKSADNVIEMIECEAVTDKKLMNLESDIHQVTVTSEDTADLEISTEVDKGATYYESESVQISLNTEQCVITENSVVDEETKTGLEQDHAQALLVTAETELVKILPEEKEPFEKEYKLKQTPKKTDETGVVEGILSNNEQKETEPDQGPGLIKNYEAVISETALAETTQHGYYETVKVDLTIVQNQESYKTNESVVSDVIVVKEETLNAGHKKEQQSLTADETKVGEIITVVEETMKPIVTETSNSGTEPLEEETLQLESEEKIPPTNDKTAALQEPTVEEEEVKSQSEQKQYRVMLTTAEISNVETLENEKDIMKTGLQQEKDEAQLTTTEMVILEGAVEGKYNMKTACQVEQDKGLHIAPKTVTTDQVEELETSKEREPVQKKDEAMFTSGTSVFLEEAVEEKGTIKTEPEQEEETVVLIAIDNSIVETKAVDKHALKTESEHKLVHAVVTTDKNTAVESTEEQDEKTLKMESEQDRGNDLLQTVDKETVETATVQQHTNKAEKYTKQDQATFTTVETAVLTTTAVEEHFMKAEIEIQNNSVITPHENAAVEIIDVDENTKTTQFEQDQDIAFNKTVDDAAVITSMEVDHTMKAETGKPEDQATSTTVEIAVVEYTEVEKGTIQTETEQKQDKAAVETVAANEDTTKTETEEDHDQATLITTETAAVEQDIATTEPEQEQDTALLTTIDKAAVEIIPLEEHIMKTESEREEDYPAVTSDKHVIVETTAVNEVTMKLELKQEHVNTAAVETTAEKKTINTEPEKKKDQVVITTAETAVVESTAVEDYTFKVEPEQDHNQATFTTSETTIATVEKDIMMIETEQDHDKVLLTTADNPDAETTADCEHKTIPESVQDQNDTIPKTVDRGAAETAMVEEHTMKTETEKKQNQATITTVETAVVKSIAVAEDTKKTETEQEQDQGMLTSAETRISTTATVEKDIMKAESKNETGTALLTTTDNVAVEINTIEEHIMKTESTTKQEQAVSITDETVLIESIAVVADILTTELEREQDQAKLTNTKTAAAVTTAIEDDKIKIELEQEHNDTPLIAPEAEQEQDSIILKTAETAVVGSVLTVKKDAMKIDPEEEQDTTLLVAPETAAIQTAAVEEGTLNTELEQEKDQVMLTAAETVVSTTAIVDKDIMKTESEHEKGTALLTTIDAAVEEHIMKPESETKQEQAVSITEETAVIERTAVEEDILMTKLEHKQNQATLKTKTAIAETIAVEVDIMKIEPEPEQNDTLLLTSVTEQKQDPTLHTTAETTIAESAITVKEDAMKIEPEEGQDNTLFVVSETAAEEEYTLNTELEQEKDQAIHTTDETVTVEYTMKTELDQEQGQILLTTAENVAVGEETMKKESEKKQDQAILTNAETLTAVEDTRKIELQQEEDLLALTNAESIVLETTITEKDVMKTAPEPEQEHGHFATAEIVIGVDTMKTALQQEQVIVDEATSNNSLEETIQKTGKSKILETEVAEVEIMKTKSKQDEEVTRNYKTVVQEMADAEKETETIQFKQDDKIIYTDPKKEQTFLYDENNETMFLERAAGEDKLMKLQSNQYETSNITNEIVVIETILPKEEGVTTTAEEPHVLLENQTVMLKTKMAGEGVKRDNKQEEVLLKSVETSLLDAITSADEITQIKAEQVLPTDCEIPLTETEDGKTMDKKLYQEKLLHKMYGVKILDNATVKDVTIKPKSEYNLETMTTEKFVTTEKIVTNEGEIKTLEQEITVLNNTEDVITLIDKEVVLGTKVVEGEVEITHSKQNQASLKSEEIAVYETTIIEKKTEKTQSEEMQDYASPTTAEIITEIAAIDNKTIENNYDQEQTLLEIAAAKDEKIINKFEQDQETTRNYEADNSGLEKAAAMLEYKSDEEAVKLTIEHEKIQLRADETGDVLVLNATVTEVEIAKSKKQLSKLEIDKAISLETVTIEEEPGRTELFTDIIVIQEPTEKEIALVESEEEYRPHKIDETLTLETTMLKVEEPTQEQVSNKTDESTVLEIIATKEDVMKNCQQEQVLETDKTLISETIVTEEEASNKTDKSMVLHTTALKEEVRTKSDQDQMPLKINETMILETIVAEEETVVHEAASIEKDESMVLETATEEEAVTLKSEQDQTILKIDETGISVTSALLDDTVITNSEHEIEVLDTPMAVGYKEQTQNKYEQPSLKSDGTSLSETAATDDRTKLDFKEDRKIIEVDDNQISASLLVKIDSELSETQIKDDKIEVLEVVIMNQTSEQTEHLDLFVSEQNTKSETALLQPPVNIDESDHLTETEVVTQTVTKEELEYDNKEPIIDINNKAAAEVDNEIVELESEQNEPTQSSETKDESREVLVSIDLTTIQTAENGELVKIYSSLSDGNKDIIEGMFTDTSEIKQRTMETAINDLITIQTSIVEKCNSQITEKIIRETGKTEIIQYDECLRTQNTGFSDVTTDQIVTELMEEQKIVETNSNIIEMIEKLTDEPNTDESKIVGNIVEEDVIQLQKEQQIEELKINHTKTTDQNTKSIAEVERNELQKYKGEIKEKVEIYITKELSSIVKHSENEILQIHDPEIEENSSADQKGEENFVIDNVPGTDTLTLSEIKSKDSLEIVELQEPQSTSISEPNVNDITTYENIEELNDEQIKTENFLINIKSNEEITADSEILIEYFGNSEEITKQIIEERKITNQEQLHTVTATQNRVKNFINNFEQMSIEKICLKKFTITSPEIENQNESLKTSDTKLLKDEIKFKEIVQCSENKVVEQEEVPSKEVTDTNVQEIPGNDNKCQELINSIDVNKENEITEKCSEDSSENIIIPDRPEVNEHGMHNTNTCIKIYEEALKTTTTEEILKDGKLDKHKDLTETNKKKKEKPISKLINFFELIPQNDNLNFYSQNLDYGQKEKLPFSKNSMKTNSEDEEFLSLQNYSNFENSESYIDLRDENFTMKSSLQEITNNIIEENIFHLCKYESPNTDNVITNSYTNISSEFSHSNISDETFGSTEHLLLCVEENLEDTYKLESLQIEFNSTNEENLLNETISSTVEHIEQITIENDANKCLNEDNDLLGVTEEGQINFCTDTSNILYEISNRNYKTLDKNTSAIDITNLITTSLENSSTEDKLTNNMQLPIQIENDDDNCDLMIDNENMLLTLENNKQSLYTESEKFTSSDIHKEKTMVNLNKNSESSSQIEVKTEYEELKDTYNEITNEKVTSIYLTENKNNSNISMNEGNLLNETISNTAEHIEQITIENDANKCLNEDNDLLGVTEEGQINFCTDTSNILYETSNRNKRKNDLIFQEEIFAEIDVPINIEENINLEDDKTKLITQHIESSQQNLSDVLLHSNLIISTSTNTENSIIIDYQKENISETIDIRNEIFSEVITEKVQDKTLIEITEEDECKNENTDNLISEHDIEKQFEYISNDISNYLINIGSIIQSSDISTSDSNEIKSEDFCCTTEDSSFENKEKIEVKDIEDKNKSSEIRDKSTDYEDDINVHDDDETVDKVTTDEKFEFIWKNSKMFEPDKLRNDSLIVQLSTESDIFLDNINLKNTEIDESFNLISDCLCESILSDNEMIEHVEEPKGGSFEDNLSMCCTGGGESTAEFNLEFNGITACGDLSTGFEDNFNDKFVTPQVNNNTTDNNTTAEFHLWSSNTEFGSPTNEVNSKLIDEITSEMDFDSIISAPSLNEALEKLEKRIQNKINEKESISQNESYISEPNLGETDVNKTVIDNNDDRTSESHEITETGENESNIKKNELIYDESLEISNIGEYSCSTLKTDNDIYPSISYSSCSRSSSRMEMIQEESEEDHLSLNKINSINFYENRERIENSFDFSFNRSLIPEISVSLMDKNIIHNLSENIPNKQQINAEESMINLEKFDDNLTIHKSGKLKEEELHVEHDTMESPQWELDNSQIVKETSESHFILKECIPGLNTDQINNEKYTCLSNQIISDEIQKQSEDSELTIINQEILQTTNNKENLMIDICIKNNETEISQDNVEKSVVPKSDDYTGTVTGEIITIEDIAPKTKSSLVYDKKLYWDKKLEKITKSDTIVDKKTKNTPKSKISNVPTTNESRKKICTNFIQNHKPESKSNEPINEFDSTNETILTQSEDLTSNHNKENGKPKKTVDNWKNYWDKKMTDQDEPTTGKTKYKQFSKQASIKISGIVENNKTLFEIAKENLDMDNNISRETITENDNYSDKEDNINSNDIDNNKNLSLMILKDERKVFNCIKIFEEKANNNINNKSINTYPNDTNTINNYNQRKIISLNCSHNNYSTDFSDNSTPMTTPTAIKIDYFDDPVSDEYKVNKNPNRLESVESSDGEFYNPLTMTLCGRIRSFSTGKIEEIPDTDNSHTNNDNEDDNRTEKSDPNTLENKLLNDNLLKHPTNLMTRAKSEGNLLFDDQLKSHIRFERARNFFVKLEQSSSCNNIDKITLKMSTPKPSKSSSIVESTSYKKNRQISLDSDSCGECCKPKRKESKYRRRGRRRKDSMKISRSAPTSDSENKIIRNYDSEFGGSERRKSKKLSDLCHIKDLFSDISRSSDGIFRGIPNRKAVLASLKSVEDLRTVSPCEEDEEPTRSKSVSSIPMGYLDEYPYLPTTPPNRFKPRSQFKGELIPRRALLLLDI